MHALKGLALPHGEIALAGSRRLRSTRAAEAVLFAHATPTLDAVRVPLAVLLMAVALPIVIMQSPFMS